MLREIIIPKTMRAKSYLLILLVLIFCIVLTITTHI